MQNGQAVDPPPITQTILIWALMAIGLIWLGIGSIQARRWARTLLLCLGWIGLVCGTQGFLIILLMLGDMGEVLRSQTSGGTTPPGIVTFVKFFILLLSFVMYIAIPSALVLFYRSRHVKRTCETRDPIEPWTDRCPMPVLAQCILCAVTGLYLPFTQLTGAFPVAGFIITGALAHIAWVAVSALLFYGAWGFYHLQLRAWNVYFVSQTVLGISTAATFALVDFTTFYRLAGIPESQIKLMAALPVLQANGLLWLSLLGVIFAGLYLLYIRRFFTARIAKKSPQAEV